MAKKLILQNLMKLAQGIGANPKNFMGTKTNITFLGKGPTKNPLFQGPLAGLESAGEAQLGSRESVIGAVEDAMGFATANKLNSIQIRALELNLESLFKIYNPSAMPSASVMPIRSGIGTLKGNDIGAGPRRYNELTGLNKPRAVESTLPDPGTAGVTAMLDQKTGMSRAIARQILQQDTRLNLPEEVLISLRTGSKGADPLDLMKKYYGESMLNFDDFLNQANLEVAGPAEFAEMVLKHVKLTPQFAEGGLAEILQVPRSGYSKGRLVKGALAILNRNKKNAEYMFKASDNVSPGYAKGDMKYNAELLADQLAEDAGVVYNDLGDLERIKFYGTAYDYLAKEMGQYRQMTKMLTDVEQKMQLSDFSIKGRKPNASGGLAGILEV